MTTIMGSNQIEEGHGSAIITLPHSMVIHIKLSIYAPNATRNLISFKDIKENGYHIHTNTNKDQEFITILQDTCNGMQIKETFIVRLPLGLLCYSTTYLPYGCTRKVTI